MSIKIGIVDDHQLFLKSLTLLLETSGLFEVVTEAPNGLTLQDKLKESTVLPDILLIDVDMPKLNGIDTTRWVAENFPGIKLVALSMNSKDEIIIEMIRAGCCAYLLKDTHPAEFQKAMEEINAKGHYNGDVSNINYRRLMTAEMKMGNWHLSDREKQFLQYACSDLTYKMIASLMNVSERSVDSYREALFNKFNVQSRVGLCLEAIRNNLVTI